MDGWMETEIDRSTEPMRITVKIPTENRWFSTSLPVCYFAHMQDASSTK